MYFKGSMTFFRCKYNNYLPYKEILWKKKRQNGVIIGIFVMA